MGLKIKVMYKAELKQVLEEYDKIASINEDDACRHCMADSKEEALEAIKEEIEFLNHMIEKEEFESDDYTYYLDPAFSSWEDVNKMFV